MAEMENTDLEKDTVDETVVQNNKLTFDEKVIKKIIGYSTNGIPGILAMSGNFISGITDMLKSGDDPTKGISIEMGEKQVSVSMRLICEYGRNIPAIFQEIIEKANAAVMEMTGLKVSEVKVHVYDILTKEDFERQSKKRFDEKPVDTSAEALEDATADESFDA